MGTGYSSRQSEFNSQYSHGSSQLSMMGSDGFFWLHEDKASIYINYINISFKEYRKEKIQMWGLVWWYGAACSRN